MKGIYKLVLLILLGALSSCTTYKIGKFKSVTLRDVPSIPQKNNSNKVVRTELCVTNFFGMPLVAHDVEKALKSICPKSSIVRKIEVHEEVWTTLVIGRTCTVVSGVCDES